ncbi:LuxR family transcriptional regulator [Streptomyces sp. NPDC057298]|uniref:LuxR family transcriptional regulator n=1 Tax=Streptomyces sp. NPDC057298 TaxID=3346091 RepID=UPI0036344B86
MQQGDTFLVGRDNDVRVIAEALRPSEAAQVLLVCGGSGIGKTAVLERARLEAVQQGLTVLQPTWGAFEGKIGAAALVDAVCDALAEHHDGRLLTRVTAIRRSQSRTADGRAEWGLLSTMRETLEEAASHAPFAIVFDDAERMPPRTAAELGLMLRVFRPRGIPVVMAGRPMTYGSGTDDLVAAADRFLDLPPLSPDEIAALIEQRLGHPVETGLVTTVRRVLGPLEGNPRAVLSVLAVLDERGYLLELDGRLDLTETGNGVRFTSDLAEPCRLGWPATPPDADRMETAVTLAHLCGNAEIRLDDLAPLASLAGQGADTMALSLNQLFRDGVLTVDEDSRVSFAVPAAAASLRALPASRDMQSLHAGLARSAADRLGATTAGSCHPHLADHVTAAGPMLNDTLANPLLLSAARTYARTDHSRALRAYRSVLDRLSPRAPAMRSVLREAAELALRHSDHVGVLVLEVPLLAALQLSHPTGLGDLAFTARALAWASLHEHHSPSAADATFHARAVLERMPGAAELAALGGLYGIGPSSLRPEHGHQPTTDQVYAEEPLPAAELRLLAAAVVGSAETQRARQGLPPDAIDETALEQLHNAAAYGDLAGALEAVLGDRYVATGDSTAVRYHAMVRQYLTGRWDEALSSARRIETRGRSGGSAGVSQLARALAAEIHCFRGDIGRARTWLELIPDSAAHPLANRARLVVRAGEGRLDEVMEDGWSQVRCARRSGQLAGTEGIMLQIFAHALYNDRPQTAQRAMSELAALHEEVASPMTREAALLARGVLHRDVDSALAAYRMVRQRGDALLEMYCQQWLADISGDPGLWLAEASHSAHRLGIGRSFRALINRAARRRNVMMPPPRRPAVHKGLNEQDLQLIEMISKGATNRQLAVRLACSEKTVERRLTRLFQRTGRRSRVELAAAWLDGTLT